MRSTKYPRIPTTRSQLTTTVALAIVFVIFIYFFNPEGQLSLDWKRYLTRAGGILIMLGGVLGAYVYLHSENNWEKHALAQQAFQEGVEDVRRLMATSAGSLAASLRLERLQGDIADAATALDQASTFEKSAAKLGIAALVFLVLGTILQFWAA